MNWEPEFFLDEPKKEKKILLDGQDLSAEDYILNNNMLEEDGSFLLWIEAKASRTLIFTS